MRISYLGPRNTWLPASEH